MNKVYIVLAFLLVGVVGCSSFEPRLNSSDQVESALDLFISNEILMDNYSTVVDDGDSFQVILENNNSMFFDKKTGIMYCLQEQGQDKNCGSVYLVMLNNSLLIDLEGLSCTPLVNGSIDVAKNCDNSTIDYYYSLQQDLHRRNLYLPQVQK